LSFPKFWGAGESDPCNMSHGLKYALSFKSVSNFGEGQAALASLRKFQMLS